MKEKFELEIPIQASSSMLYQYLTTPSGLAEWYADNVNSRGELFTFIWDGSEEEAKMLSKKKDLSVRYQWLEDEGEDYYFEVRIQVDAITKDVSLMITDFSDEDDLDENKMLWENQIASLKKVIGSA